MKNFTFAALVIIALIGVLASPIVGMESMLDEGDTSLRLENDRRLASYWQKKYKSIYYRCCNTGAGPVEDGEESKNNPKYIVNGCTGDNCPDADEYCQCPVRGKDESSCSWCWWTSKTPYEKWQASCQEGGKIYRKAGIGN